MGILDPVGVCVVCTRVGVHKAGDMGYIMWVLGFEHRSTAKVKYGLLSQMLTNF